MTVFQRVAHIAVVILGAVLASGCGFHLRGYEVQSNVESFYVLGERSSLAAPLRRALRQAGVTEAETVQTAQVVVELLDERLERRSVSVASGARTAEYEVSLAGQYRVLAAGAELVAPTWLQLQRVYRLDRDNIVGSSEEQSLLESEMRNDLIQQIIRTVDAVTRNDPGSDAAGSAVTTGQTGQ